MVWRLIGRYDSPFVRRVGVSLEVLGIPFERHLLSVFGDGDQMRALNPLVRVPALVLDDGETLIDSTAILDHQDEVVGSERALLPAAGKARRDALKIVALATGLGDKTVAIVYERRKPAAKVDESWIGRCRSQQDGALAALEKCCAAGVLTGPRLMQPEITVACMLGYVRLRQPATLPAGRYPSLQALSARSETHPAFVACRPSPQEIGGPTKEASLALLRLLGDQQSR
jgi:glutathione S-transferase